jgi:hypothetical protein
MLLGVYSTIFLLLGILGFVPEMFQEGLLLGIFEVSEIHNLMFIVTGVAGVLVLISKSAVNAVAYFQFIGLFYALITILGSVLDGNAIVIHTNIADNLLHAFLATVALYTGFVSNSQPPAHHQSTSE